MSETTLAGRVVVGVDGSPPAQAALSWGARHAAARGGALTVLMALPPVFIGDPGTVLLRELAQTSEAEAMAVLESARDEVVATHPGLDVEVRLVRFLPADTLIRASGEAELLVIGAHGRAGFVDRLLGSTADQVATHARGPVIVVPEKPGYPADGPIVVGVDASEQSAQALRFAFDLAAALSAPLTAVHAWDLDLLWSTAPVALEPEDLTAMVDAAKRALAEAVQPEAAGHPQVQVSESVQRGGPASVLEEASRSASLVVVGSRGRGGFTGLLLGSTSRSLLHAARCPVAVISSLPHGG
jgi:nucleotide-binding universal stress UspA family protein